MALSNCCGAEMPMYPEYDFCPECKEHCVSEEDDMDFEPVIEKKKGPLTHFIEVWSGADAPIMRNGNVYPIEIINDILSHTNKWTLQTVAIFKIYPYAAI